MQRFVELIRGHHGCLALPLHPGGCYSAASKLCPSLRYEAPGCVSGRSA
jgi:hypothetical protein